MTVLIYIIAAIYSCIVIYMMKKVNMSVPEAYMDEVFHYPMTERYFNGDIFFFLFIYQGTILTGIQRSLLFRDYILLEACLCFMKMLMYRYCRFRYVVLSIFGVHNADSEMMCPLSSLRWMNMIILFFTTGTVFLILRKANPEHVNLRICYNSIETSETVFVGHSDHEYSYDSLSIFSVLHRWTLPILFCVINLICFHE